MSQIEEKAIPKVRDFDGYDWFLTKTYRRNLPHWELTGSTYFITFRVDPKMGSPFENPKIAEFMISFLCNEDTKFYQLHAYVVMPDHIHLIIKPLSGHTLAKILRYLKGSTAFGINKLLKRTGKFWQSESFDHLIRNDSGLIEKWEYIKNNPLKAKIVTKPEDYPFSSFYIRPESQQDTD